MFQSCLICTDFTDGLERLVNFVPALASGGFTKIVFFHSVPLWQEGEIPRVDEAKIEQAKQRFAKAQLDLPAGLEVIVEVASGKPLDTIPRLLKTHPVDVIFTGTPIRSLLQEKLFGSTTLGLTKLSSAPVMILRPQLISTFTSEELSLRCQHLWNCLLIPYNDSKAARYLIDRLKTSASDRQMNSPRRCTLAWVVEESRQKLLTENRLQEAEAKLNALKVELESTGWEVNLKVSKGLPVLTMLEIAANADISAIAIAADSKVNWFERAVPSFAEELLRRSWFPLLLFSC
jgi:nucleotide-binding universal stress UspA family protein